MTRPISMLAAIRPPGSTASIRVPSIRPLALEEIPPGNSVLHGDDDRLRAQKAADLPRHRRDLMGFHRQDDKVVHAGLGDLVGRDHRAGQALGAVVEDQPDAVFPERLEVRAAADERHLLTGQNELSPEHAADRPGADDTDLHDRVPCHRGLDRRIMAERPCWKATQRRLTARMNLAWGGDFSGRF